MKKNFFSVKRILLLVLSLCLFPNLAAVAQQNNLQARIDQLSAQQEKNAQDLAKAINLLNKIQQDFNAIQGQQDSSKYVEQENQRVYQDLDVRVASLEDQLSQAQNLIKTILNTPAAAPVSGPAGKGAAKAVSAAENEEFDKLLAIFNARDYRGAASGFMGFIKKYPNSELSGSAQYWTAESFYGLSDYAKSIQEFQTFIEKYPNHRFTKEAYFKQGSGFMNLKKYPEAKLFFQKIVTNFPQSAEAAKAQARLHRIAELEKSAPSSPAPSSAQPPAASAAPAPSSGNSIYRNPVMKPISVTEGPVAAPEKLIPPPPPPQSAPNPAPANTPSSDSPLF